MGQQRSALHQAVAEIVAKAKEFREAFGAEPQARSLEWAALQVERALRDESEQLLTLAQAADLSGWRADSLLESRTLASDDEGWYEVTRVRPGKVLLKVEHPGHVTWYRRDVIRPVGMVEMYHYQSMWNNRQDPRIYEIFRAVHGTDELAVSIDRVGLKPPDNPAHPEYDHKGMIHCSCCSRYSRIFGVTPIR